MISQTSYIQTTLHWPWLLIEFRQTMNTLGWALNAPGFQTLQQVVWREVRNADLPPNLDVQLWLNRELEQAAYRDTAAFLTSANIHNYQRHCTSVENVTAEAIATVGLSNAERIGSRQPSRWPAGTVNLLVAVSKPLQTAALIETLAIAVQARTAAIMEHGPNLNQGRATGTGTDCVLIAAPALNQTEQTEALEFAGLHTALGEAVGHCVYQTIAAGTQTWMQKLDNDLGLLPRP